AAWRGPKPNEVLAQRRALERNIITAAPAARSAARLDLAHFYFAQGLGAEALGVLDAIQRDDPNFAADPHVRAVVGGVLFAMGPLDEAERELSLPALDGENEIALWRGAIAYAKRDPVTATREFARGSEVLRSYPKPLRHRFALEAADAALSEGQVGEAQDYLDLVAKAQTLHDVAMAQLLAARVLLQQGEEDSARAILDLLAVGSDRAMAARARLDRLSEDLGAGTISRGDALKELDGLRFVWRGDDVELAVLRRLGELRMKDGDFGGGFAALRQAAELFPDYPEAKGLQQQMA